MGGKPRQPREVDRVTVIPVSAWTLLPPAPDACQECGHKHEPNLPHNAQSIYWQTKRQIEGLPPATWDDALAHVSDAMHLAWRIELMKHGVLVAPRALAGGDGG